MYQNDYCVVSDVGFLAQPIVNRTGRVIFYEILSRISDDKQRSISNEDFFSNCSVEVVKEIFLSQLKSFTQYEELKGVAFSYNLNLSNLADDGLVECILGAKGYPIYIEIAKFDYSSTAQITNNIQRLQGAGVRILFDDFDYLNHEHHSALTLCSWDGIKVDGKYARFEYYSKWLLLVVDFLKNYTSKVVIEGVESNTIVQRLINKSVEFQGYWFSSGVTKEQLLMSQEPC